MEISNLMKTNPSNLAPIELEILLCPPRRTQKIERDSGTARLLKNKTSAPENKKTVLQLSNTAFLFPLRKSFLIHTQIP